MERDVSELLGIVRPVYTIFPLTGKSFLLILAASTSAAAGLLDCLNKVLGRLSSDCCQLMSAHALYGVCYLILVNTCLSFQSGGYMLHMYQWWLSLAVTSLSFVILHYFNFDLL